jgi:hypothetical protein
VVSVVFGQNIVQPFQLTFFPSPDGGIGRHKGFKIPRRSRCAGSSPAPGTMGKIRIKSKQ